MDWIEIKRALTEKFCKNGLQDDLADIDWIGVEILKINRSGLNFVREIDEEKLKQINKAAEKRLMHIPLAYIFKKTNFFGYDLIVDENVLIPRIDTEILVQEIIKSINKRQNLVFVADIGTGSGAIAISIKKQTNAKVFAVDISENALEIAKLNAKNNDADIEFAQSNVFENFSKDKFDFIVSNPPYIKTDVVLQLEPEVKDNEPVLALDGGTDGLDFYRQIIDESGDYLNKNGELWFEIGYDQAESVKKLMEKKFKNIKIYKDYGGNDRVVSGEKI